MNRLLLIGLLVVFPALAFTQTGYLFVKKGFKKKRTYTEGDNITLQLKDHSTRYGLITLLRNDTIFLGGRRIPLQDVKTVILHERQRQPFHVDGKTWLLVTGGVALVTAGLSLSNQAEFNEALLAGAVIGYGPIAVGYLKSKISLKRRRYKIGKKFRLQILDFYLPTKRGF
jgi:hypothetical protein